MGKREKRRPAEPTPFNAGLASLASRMGDLPPPSEATPPAKPPARPPVRAVVRMERAGRGGRTVTVVEKLDLRPSDLEAWLGDMKRALGCGGVVEGAALVLQGDTRERAGAWLERRGVKKVTVA